MAEPTKTTVLELALRYFRVPEGYFWRWAEGQEVVEWIDGTTIAYRSDLTAALEALAGPTMPTLGSVLLVLAAGQDTWAESGGPGILSGLAQQLATDHTVPWAEFDQHLRHALQVLELVNQLPPELRMGPRKQHLLRELFAPGPDLPALWPPDLMPAVVGEWASGRLDSALAGAPGPLTARRYKADLLFLAQAARRFPTAAALELRVRTGLDQLPVPAALPLPPPLAPEPAADLLDQLAPDARTAGLARLARRLSAALHLPLHAHGASDQPFGGVSDITNRGTFDRLLLSELAHDDLTFTARLLNNEALYLRREEPPHEQPRARVILLDTTLPMWGLPRVFALAAALAWARQARPGQRPAATTAAALGATTRTTLDLTTPAGILAALELLDPALHCTAALAQAEDAANLADRIFITETSQLHHPALLNWLARGATGLRYLLTVDRSGEMQLHEFRQGHRHLLSTTRFDLEELLFTAPKPTPDRLPEGWWPEFMARQPAPLRLPAPGDRAGDGNSFWQEGLGVLLVTTTQRVLYWPRKDRGALELLPRLEAGQYRFSSDGRTAFFLLVSRPADELLWFYRLPVHGGMQGRVAVDLSAEVRGLTRVPYITWRDETVAFWVNGKFALVDCLTGAVVERSSAAPPTATQSSSPSWQSGSIKRFVNNGYSTMQRVNELGVNAGGQLLVNGWGLQMADGNLRLTAPPRTEPAVTAVRADAQPLPLPENPRVLLHRFRWPDGSQALADPRGLLHLRSADPSVPDITLVLVQNRSLGAWAADGTVAGNVYFTNLTGQEPYAHPDGVRWLSVPDFYARYLQPFLARLAP